MIEFTLPDMTCGHCEKAVTAALQQADPAARFSISLPTHTVQVTHNAQPAEVLAAALREAGYAPAAPGPRA